MEVAEAVHSHRPSAKVEKSLEHHHSSTESGVGDRTRGFTTACEPIHKPPGFGPDAWPRVSSRSRSGRSSRRETWRVETSSIQFVGWAQRTKLGRSRLGRKRIVLNDDASLDSLTRRGSPL